MIVDLLRNDLNRCSVARSVEVLEAAALRSFPTVHHLVATIRSRLKPGLTLGEMLAALCPAGSITGAPKREVMGAIRAYEGRARGFFMGHAFYLDRSGRFDSSILIRTLVGKGKTYEFAAGSGIVLDSEPWSEQREVDAKCGVLTAL